MMVVSVPASLAIYFTLFWWLAVSGNLTWLTAWLPLAVYVGAVEGVDFLFRKIDRARPDKSGANAKPC